MDNAITFSASSMTTEADTFSEGYQEIVKKLIYNPQFITNPRNSKTNELLNHTLIIRNPLNNNLFFNSFRNIPLKYLKKEFRLYLGQTNKAARFSAASPFWGKIATEDGKINSAYGYLIFKKDPIKGFSQFDWVVNSLIKDKDTRQAVMFYNRPNFQYENNKDFVCTLNNMFFIRENKLLMFVNMRANDVRRGMMFDIPFFMLVQYLVYLKLKPVYPELEIGPFVHHAYSLHLYYSCIPGDDDISLMKNMLAGEWKSESYPYPTDVDFLLANNNLLLEDVETLKTNLQKYPDYPNHDFYAWLLS